MVISNGLSGHPFFVLVYRRTNSVCSPRAEPGLMPGQLAPILYRSRPAPRSHAITYRFSSTLNPVREASAVILTCHDGFLCPSSLF